jgi:hypothetical protein
MGTVAGPSALHVMGADVSRMVLEGGDDSGCKHFSESTDSHVDYAQQENRNEIDQVLQENVDHDVVA